ncbi:hypothetical protein M231_04466 [Tremella mesenterica]|uniref:Peptidase M20 dimerisation domain-containing protein n=1 Tax=Tremella mesenterica TaxID=5217 RepID=A0A4Q1BKI0_TREME|nr:hypothetical protein M231_04466 [Tremella mesenterica]
MSASMSDKSQVPISLPPSSPRGRYSQFSFLALVIILLCFFSSTTDVLPLPRFLDCGWNAHRAALEAAKCPSQPKPLNVGSDWDPLKDSKYASLAAERLSKAVQVRTESFDNFIYLPANDSQYDKFFAFSAFLEKELPKVYSALKHEAVNIHGHLFTWEGKQKDLKPILLMAHIDTVPVNPDTEDQWVFPPFAGEIAVDATPEATGTWIWGRGSSDCKNSLMAILGSVERLVSEGFEPERTILLGFGYDEEIGGWKGAGSLAKLLEERYGSDSVAFLVDEGFSGLAEEYGNMFMSLGMAEKGASTFHIKVETLGGHSSVPPPHTGIGVMAQLLIALESHPFEPSLVPASPYMKYLSCLSEYAPDIPRSLKRRVRHPKMWKKLARDLAKSDRILNSYLSTTQAIDIIHGGVKVNALPELVEAQINHRISFTSSVKETIDHFKSVITPIAEKLNFTLSAFDNSTKTSEQHITIGVTSSGGQGQLEPAPITEPDTQAWELLAGTLRHMFGKETIVAPTGMFANTDTKHMWKLTKNLYRFMPASITGAANIHTVNERLSLDAHLNTTRFYYKLLQNVQTWKAD